MGQMVNLFTEPIVGEHGYLFSGNELGNKEHGCLFLTPKEQMLNSQLTARVKASGKAQRAYPTPLPRESQITMAARLEHR